MKYFDETFFTRLKEATVTTHTGVTAGFCDKVFTPQVYEELQNTFPDPTDFMLVDKADSGGGHKKFYVGPHYVTAKDNGSVYHLKNLPPIWRGLLDELASDEIMKEISVATGTEVNTLCVFGLTYGDEGCVQEPHLDGAIREGDNTSVKANLAFLLYFNEIADPVSATEIYDLDRKTILLKGTTMRNSLAYFKQHPHSWHGFPEVPKGHTRRLLSLTYLHLPKPTSIDWSFSHYIISRIQRFLRRVRGKAQKEMFGQ